MSTTSDCLAARSGRGPGAGAGAGAGEVVVVSSCTWLLAAWPSLSQESRMAKLPHSLTRTLRFRKWLFLCSGVAGAGAGAGGGGDGDLGAGSCTLGSWPTSTPSVAPLQNHRSQYCGHRGHSKDTTLAFAWSSAQTQHQSYHRWCHRPQYCHFHWWPIFCGLTSPGASPLPRPSWCWSTQARGLEDWGPRTNWHFSGHTPRRW